MDEKPLRRLPTIKPKTVSELVDDIMANLPQELEAEAIAELPIEARAAKRLSQATVVARPQQKAKKYLLVESLTATTEIKSKPPKRYISDINRKLLKENKPQFEKLWKANASEIIDNMDFLGKPNKDRISCACETRRECLKAWKCLKGGRMRRF